MHAPSAQGVSGCSRFFAGLLLAGLFLTYVRPLVGTDFPTATRLNAPKVD